MLARITRAERLFTHAQKLFTSGKFEAATDKFKTAHALVPDHFGVCLHLALALSETGPFDDACDLMQRAIALCPSNSVLYMFLGQIYFDHENFLEAKKQFTTSIEIDPFNANTRAYLALISLIEGNFQHSYDSFTQAISIPQGTVEQKICQLGISNPPCALQVATIALQSRVLVAIETYFLQHKLAPLSLSKQLVDIQLNLPPSIASRCLAVIDSLLTHVILGTKRFLVSLRYVYNSDLRRDAIRHIQADESYYLCQTSQAISSYQQILKRQPELQTIKRRLFELLYETGEFGSALTYMQEVTHYGTDQHRPTPLECLYLGELLYLSGNAHEGRQYLDQALLTEKSEFKLYYLIGLDELKAGRKANARKFFSKSLRLLNPDICILRLQELKRIFLCPTRSNPIVKTVSTVSEQH